MGGEGSIMQMIVSYRNNMGSLRRTGFNKGRSFSDNKRLYFEQAHGKIDLKKATKEELATVRAKIIKQRKTERIKIWIILTICISLFAFVIYKVLNYRTGYIESEKVVVVVPNEDPAKYSYYLNDGDAWLELNNWHNAIYQYLKAQQVYPDKYEVEFRLAKAYTLRCEAEQISCVAAMELLNKLISEHPEIIELYELRASYYLDKGENEKAKADYDKVNELKKN